MSRNAAMKVEACGLQRRRLLLHYPSQNAGRIATRPTQRFAFHHHPLILIAPRYRTGNSLCYRPIRTGLIVTGMEWDVKPSLGNCLEMNQ